MPHFLDTLLNGPSRWGEAHHFSTGWLAIFAIVVLLAELVIAYVLVWGVFLFFQNTPSIFRLLLQKCGVGEKNVPQAFLELVFPADTTKSAYATEQLHILLRGLVKYYGFWDRLAARKKPYSLELVGTNDDGIRFILMVPASEADIVQRNLLSFLPGLKVRPTTDYAQSLHAEDTDIIELKLGSDFILPLKDHKALEEHDPFAYLTGHMTKLAPDELVAFQIVAVPVFNTTHRRVTRRQRKIEGRIALGKDVISQIKRQRSPVQYLLWLLWYPPLWFLAAMGKCIAIAGDVVFSVLSGQTPEAFKSSKDKRPKDNPYDREMGETLRVNLTSSCMR